MLLNTERETRKSLSSGDIIDEYRNSTERRTCFFIEIYDLYMF